MTEPEVTRPYISVGDYVVTEDIKRKQRHEGVVIADDEGTLRVADENGHNVNADWINVIEWKGH